MRGADFIASSGRRAILRVRSAAPAVAATTAGLLLAVVVMPAPAHAVDLFPIDDWIGDGLKSVGKVVLGPLKLGAEAIAKLLGAIVAALADLLIPKSLIEAGLGAIEWLVELPPLGTDLSTAGPVGVRMPHLGELRDTLTWIGLTLLPLQIVVAGGRSLLSPMADGDSPVEVLERTVAAALGLIAFNWLWGAMTELVRLITRSLLSLPWVADGVERMLEALVIGGAAGTAVAAEFVVPLILAVAGAVLLALMLLRIGLEVIASIVYVTGGIALGLSVSSAGARLLQAWLVAATAVFVLPVLWCVVFVCGAALMLDSGAGDSDGFGGFVAQLYNVGAALVTFAIAIKLARATLGHAGTAITGLAAASRVSARGMRDGQSTTQRGCHAYGPSTPQSLVRFSQSLRGGVRGGAAGAARAGAFPVRHPLQAAAYARHPGQAARAASEHVRSSAKDGAAVSGAKGGGSRQDEREGSRADRRRRATATGAGSRPVESSRSTDDPRPNPGRALPEPPIRPQARAARSGPAPAARTTSADRESAPGAASTHPVASAPRASVDRVTANAWRTTRRVVAPARRTSKRRRKKP